jgi:hypothetical protein
MATKKTAKTKLLSLKTHPGSATATEEHIAIEYEGIVTSFGRDTEGSAFFDLVPAPGAGGPELATVPVTFRMPLGRKLALAIGDRFKVSLLASRLRP